MTAIKTNAVGEAEFRLVLNADEWRTVQQVLLDFAPCHCAQAFGSRVRLNTDSSRLKAHADLDIALSGPPLPAQAMFALRDAFSESDLPFRVDVSMRAELPAVWRDTVPYLTLREPAPSSGHHSQPCPTSRET